MRRRRGAWGCFLGAVGATCIANTLAGNPVEGSNPKGIPKSQHNFPIEKITSNIPVSQSQVESPTYTVINSPTTKSIDRQEALDYQENPIQEPYFSIESLESMVFWGEELLNMAIEGEGSNQGSILF
jgi:hypothetical protein